MKHKVLKGTLIGVSFLASLLFTTVAHGATNSMYRLYNPNSSEHFYTDNPTERDQIKSAGWSYEGTGWEAPTDGAPVYRLYNPNAGDHHYTMSNAERDSLVKVGWNYEGISWKSGGQLPVYRLYNPNAKSGAHHYTTLVAERDQLEKVGWKYEGVGFYAVAGGKQEQNSKPSVQPRPVDVNLTGVGGGEQNLAGSYRLLYSNKDFDQATLSDKATIEYSADVALFGTQSDYELQFVIAGNGDGNGQIGVGLHYQAGTDKDFGQGHINVTNINFPAGAGIEGQQYYSVNTDAPQISDGQTVKLRVKYYDSGYMQAFVNGVLVGQYKTKLIAKDGAFILHSNTNATVKIRKIQVFRDGNDVTSKGRPSFTDTSFDLTNSVVAGAY